MKQTQSKGIAKVADPENLSIKAQLQRYAVALISLAVALSSLGYNTWRNERTEANRNIRAAGFEMILAMSKLHEVIFFNRFDHDNERGDEKRGWSVVLGLSDLSMVMPLEVQNAARNLLNIWQSESSTLNSSASSFEQLNDAIDKLRKEILGALESLS